MNRNNTVLGWPVALAAAALGVAAGCGPAAIDDSSGIPPPIRVEKIDYVAEAGLEPTLVTGPEADMVQVAKRFDSGRRSDPFHMLAPECDFEQAQLTERLLNEAGGFSSYFEEPDTRSSGPTLRSEPLPLWRLSGVLLSDGVCALLDKGSETVMIRPGMTIEGSEWTVVSIDSERAVLRRRNTVPREFIVPLQGRIDPGTGGGGGGGGGGTGGGAGTAGPRKGGGAAGAGASPD